MPKLAAWLEAIVPEALTRLSPPAVHRRKLQTTIILERISNEIKRRTSVATLFPNGQSALLLVTAALMESAKWEVNRIDLSIEA